MLTPTEMRRREAAYDAQLDCDAAELARRRKQRESDRRWRDSVRRHHRWMDLSDAAKASLERQTQARLDADPLRAIKIIPPCGEFAHKINGMLAADPSLHDRLWLQSASKGFIGVPHEHNSPEVRALYLQFSAVGKKAESIRPTIQLGPRLLGRGKRKH